MWLHVLIVVLFGLTFANPGYAQLAVDTSILELTNKTGRASVRLSNTGADTLYVNLKLQEIPDPAIDDTNTRDLNNPAEDGIIVHPRQLILQPGQTRSVRVVLSQPVQDQDRVFRLNIKPLAGEALPGQVAERTAGVRILLGYELLVLARPDSLNPDVKLQRNKDSIVFKNNGNTSVLLRKLSVCDDNDTCADLLPNRLYPNETLTVAMPQGMSGESALIRTRQSVQFGENKINYTP